jgi:hypothetical protein
LVTIMGIPLIAQMAGLMRTCRGRSAKNALSYLRALLWVVWSLRERHLCGRQHISRASHSQHGAFTKLEHSFAFSNLKFRIWSSQSWIEDLLICLSPCIRSRLTNNCLKIWFYTIPIHLTEIFVSTNAIFLSLLNLALDNSVRTVFQTFWSTTSFQ